MATSAAVTAAWVRLYTSLILKGVWTIDQVPATYKEAVAAAVAAAQAA